MYVPACVARNALGFTLFFWLAACGGAGMGVNTSVPPATSEATAQDMSDAQAADLSASLEASTKVATLTWSDTFPQGTQYAILQMGDANTWTQVDSIPGTTGSGASLTWARTTNVTTTFRVAAAKTGYEVPLDTPSGASSVQVAVPSTVPTIVLDQAQPVSGTVDASITNGGTYSSVSYYLDLTLAGTSTSAPSYSVAVNTAGLTAGAHQLIARLTSGPDSYIELRLTFQVAAGELVLSAGLPGPPNEGDPVILVDASSQYDITSVSVSLDGHSLGTLTAPNCIYPGVIRGDCGEGIYQFQFDPIATGSGPHTVQVMATDGNGVTATKTVTITVSNAPSLTLSTPIDGALVNGTLPIQGSFGTDKQGATVSLSVTLGDLPVLSTSQSPFSASFSLAGVTPGSYTLTATATDSTGQPTVVSRQVTVTSSANLVYTPIATLGKGAVIWAAGGSHLVYMNAAQTTFYRLDGGSNTILPLPAHAEPYSFIGTFSITDDGTVFASGAVSSPTANGDVYMWQPGGAPQNLSSAANPTGTDALLRVHYPWVLWGSVYPNNELVLYNLTSGQQFVLHAPSGETFGGDGDFTTLNGELALFYSTGSPAANVYRWDQASNTSVALTNDGMSGTPQTDGVRVAWETGPGGQGASTMLTLSAQDLGSGTVSMLSTGMFLFSLVDGVLGWDEQTATPNEPPSSQRILASDGTTTSTISNVLYSQFFGSSSGYVVFEESGKLYAWSSAGGRRLLFDSTPGQVHLTGKTVYFTNGSTQTLYAVALP